MEHMTERVKKLFAALDRFEESLNSIAETQETVEYREKRDSLLKRFEFTYELFWKCLKDSLEKQHGLLVASPRAVFREAAMVKMITEHEYTIFYKMVDDRNTSSHAYDEAVAEEIASRCDGSFNAIKNVSTRLFLF